MLPVSKWFSKTRRWMPAASTEKRNGGPVWEDEEKKEDARWDGLCALCAHFPTQMRPFPEAEAVSGKELQKFLQTWDPAQDASIAHELDHLRTQTQEYESKQEQLRYDQWWKDPSTAFEKKLESDAHRALKEELEKSDSFLHESSRSLPCSDGYFDITGVSNRDLSRAAESRSISYLRAEGSDELPPGSEQRRIQIIGEAAHVRAAAKAFQAEAKKAAAEQWAAHRAKVEAKRAEQQRQRDAMMAEARVAKDWDLTGSWSVECGV